MIALLQDLLNTIFPTYCMGCGCMVPPNTILCLQCEHQLPKTDYHNSQRNPLFEMIQKLAPIQHATSLFFFERRGIVQALVHQLKYMGKDHLGDFFGAMLVKELIDSPFQNCDVVVPIPLHKKRQRKRGYNQVTAFGQQIAMQLGQEYIPNRLVRHKATRTLVQLNSEQRIAQMKGAFSVVCPTLFVGKHILLIDDVVTTGTTLSEAINCLLQIEGVQVSVATIAFAKPPLP
jgi:ComF family protein